MVAGALRDGVGPQPRAPRPKVAGLTDREILTPACLLQEADGGVVVVDGEATGVARLAPGTNGFLRATLRGLVRERRRNGLGAEAPFRLTAHADGRLTLQDAATGRLVDLEAFGATNAGAFAALLRPRPDA